LFFEAMGARSPTVIVIEDLHWADDALLDFVDGLVARVNDVPLLVVATARPELLERRPGWAGGKINALTVGLGPLSTGHTTELIAEIIDRSLLPAAVEAMLLERAGGNPLYAQEYVRALVERGADATLPETVQGIIAARLDGLPPNEKSALQDAAVIGSTMWLGALCALGERDRSETDDLLLHLERKQLLRRSRRSGIAGEVELSFAHSLIREVAYSQLPRSARAARHQRAAAWLERVATDRAETAELVAHHYSTALELETALGNDTTHLLIAARNALSDASRQAAARHDHRAVLRYTEAALALEPEPRLRAELLVLRAVAGYDAGDPDESVLLEARDAAGAAGRVEDAVQLTCLLGQWAEYYATDVERTRAFDAEALTLAAGLPPGPIASLPAYQHAYRLVMSGRWPEAAAFADTEIARANEAGADSAVGLMLIWRGAARVEYDDEGGIVDLREATRILDEQAHPKAAVAAYNLADVLQGLGRLREASVAVEAAIAAAHRYGDANAMDTTECGRAMLAYHRGEREAAAATLDAVLTDTSEWVASLVLEVRGRLLLDEAPQDSSAAARRHLAYARRTANIEAECNALALAARAEVALGHHTAASSLLDEYLEVWKRSGAVMTCSRSLVEVGLALVAYQRHDDLAAATDLLRTSTPWTDAAHALAERRYADAAAILETMPSIPLRDAALALSGSVPAA
jgi:hypothetical protein